MVDYRPITDDDKQGQPKMLCYRVRKPYPDGSGRIAEIPVTDKYPAIWKDGMWRRGNGRPVEYDEEDILGVM